jgi:hypothetical protein
MKLERLVSVQRRTFEVRVMREYQDLKVVCRDFSLEAEAHGGFVR